MSTYLVGCVRHQGCALPSHERCTPSPAPLSCQPPRLSQDGPVGRREARRREREEAREAERLAREAKANKVNVYEERRRKREEEREAQERAQVCKTRVQGGWVATAAAACSCAGSWFRGFGSGCAPRGSLGCGSSRGFSRNSRAQPVPVAVLK